MTLPNVPPALVLALLACGLHLGEARPLAGQEDERPPFPEQTESQGEFEAGRVIGGSILSAYLGGLTGGVVGFLADRGTGCGNRNCEWDGIRGVVYGSVAGTVIAPVLASHWLNERRGNPVVTFLVTGGVTAGAVAAFGESSGAFVWALPAAAGVTAALTEMVTARPASRGEARAVPAPPHPGR